MLQEKGKIVAKRAGITIYATNTSTKTTYQGFEMSKMILSLQRIWLFIIT